MMAGFGFYQTPKQAEAATVWLNDEMPPWPNDIEEEKILAAAQQQNINKLYLDIAKARLVIKIREVKGKMFWCRSGTKQRIE